MISRSRFLTLAIVVGLMGLESWGGEVRIQSSEIQKAAGIARVRCNRLPEEQKQLCEEVIARRVKDYLVYERLAGRDLLNLENEYARAKRQETTWQSPCEKGDRLACRHLATARRIASSRRALYESGTKSVGASSAQLRKAIEETPAVLADKAIFVRRMCQVRGFGRIKCLRVASILALVESRTGRQLLSDIGLMESLLEIKEPATLVSCGYGYWVTVKSQGRPQGETVSHEQSEAERVHILKECGAKLGSSGRAGNLGSAGGFSGLTGVDLAPGSCALTFDLHSPEKLVARILAISSTAARGCEGVGGIGPYAGQGPYHEWVALFGEPVRPPGALTGKVFDIDLENRGSVTMDGTITGPQGDTKTEYERSDFADGHTQWVSVIKDPEGTIVWVEAGANYNDGTESRYSYTLHQDSGTETQQYAGRDGSYIESTYNADGTETHEVQTASGDGYTAKQNADGSGSYTDTDGNEIETDSNGNVTSWKRKGQEVAKTGQGCSDVEWCSNCKVSGQVIRELSGKCAAGLGSSYACHSWLQANTCCEGARSTPSDPTVAMPTPDGDMACIGGNGLSTEDRCRTFCSVASSEENCYSNCLSSHTSGVSGGLPSLLDSVCPYAYSEACTTSGTIGRPSGLGTTAGIGGQPLPPPFSTGGLILQPILPPRD